MFDKHLILFSVYYVFVCLSSAEYLSLNGNDWTAINYKKTIKVKAIVPGSIYSDLRREGVLKEDLYFGNNDVNYRWVSYDNWTFERTFNVDSSLLDKQSIYLVTEGLDTISTIFINNERVGQTNNQFVSYKFDIKYQLKSGQNSIRIGFESAPLYAKQKADEYYNKYQYKVQPECNPDKFHGECHFNFIRKMAASFSWDWGPAFPTQGIWKPIGIEAYDKAIIRDITVETTFKDDPSKWTLNVSLFIESAFNKEFDAILTITLDERQLMKDEKQRISPLSDGTASVRLVFNDLKQITPWFPNGVSNNTQKLYQLKVNLIFPDNSETSTQMKKIGFRTIELIQEPIQPEGLTFYFKVNGIPFFAKGTNWIPAHSLMEELTPQYLQHLMESTKKANMNMMRVWGGGVYESDLFYQLADELGIMIWQDFMFACALYPSNQEFLESVDSEIKTQVRRLQYHPSIAIWAGNNENELGLSSWWGFSEQSRDDYYKLYVQHILKIVKHEDISRPFVSSSPSNGLETVKENYTADYPADTRYGDTHYYSDYSQLWDFKTYPSAKFASEYGFQSYPSLETFSKVIPENKLTYPISEILENRQHHPSGTNSIERQISNYMKLPSSGGIERLNDLIYLSQITQAMAMKTETEFYRRNRAIEPNGNGYTMGALYWQLNDIWQAPTWASIEFGGKWKALHSYARNFLDNHLVSPYEEPYNTLRVSLVRDDYLGYLAFNHTIKVFKWSKISKPLYQNTILVKTESFSATLIPEISVSELLDKSDCKDRRECVLYFEINNFEHNIRANNFLLLTEPKNSRLVPPNIKLVDVKLKRRSLESQSRKYEITLSTEAVAPFVLLDFKLNSNCSGQFLDNGFFIFEEQKIIILETKQNLSEKQIRDNLTIKTLTDVV